MQLIRKISILGFVLAVFLIALVFLNKNAQSVYVDFFVTSGALTSGSLFVFGLALGVLFTLIIIMPMLIRSSYRIKRLEKTVS